MSASTQTDLSNSPGRPFNFWVLLAIVLAVTGLLSYGYYLQYVEYLDPCPLCMTQRFFYYLCGICAILGIFGLRKRIWQRLIGLLITLSAIGGLITAGRQIWLQHLPKDQVPECGTGLQYWLANKPFLDTLQLLFKGDGNCAEVQWEFLGFSIADWSFFWFTCIFLSALWLMFRRMVPRSVTAPVATSAA